MCESVEDVKGPFKAARKARAKGGRRGRARRVLEGLLGGGGEVQLRTPKMTVMSRKIHREGES